MPMGQNKPFPPNHGLISIYLDGFTRRVSSRTRCKAGNNDSTDSVGSMPVYEQRKSCARTTLKELIQTRSTGTANMYPTPRWVWITRGGRWRPIRASRDGLAGSISVIRCGNCSLRSDDVRLETLLPLG